MAKKQRIAKRLLAIDDTHLDAWLVEQRHHGASSYRVVHELWRRWSVQVTPTTVVRWTDAAMEAERREGADQ